MKITIEKSKIHSALMGLTMSSAIALMGLTATASAQMKIDMLRSTISTYT